jgi:hypothetical protein
MDRDENAARNILKFCAAGNAGIEARGQGQNLSGQGNFFLSSGTLGETRTEGGQAVDREDRDSA